MKRRLRPDEEELWQQVAKTAVPLHDRPVRPPILKSAKSESETKPAQKSPVEPIQPFQVGSKARTDTRIPAPAKSTPIMDAKAYSRMKKGRLDPEGRIDLHGMTVAEAHPELINFILRSHQKGRRLVLVITGKGQGAGEPGPIPYQRGILRRQVPHWLTQMPIAPLILQTSPASPKHGGDGALYVYLRRHRGR